MLVLASLSLAFIGPVAATPAVAGTGPVGGVTPMTPTRILDTRTSSGPVPGGGSVSFQVPGTNGFPYGTQAVVLNITATDSTAAGFLTAYHSGVSAPHTSNVNYGPGQTVANLAIVEVGADGQITIANTSTGSVQVIVDASAYFSIAGVSDAPGSYNPVVPKRLLDTRTSSGPVAGGRSVPLRLGGATGVPANAAAVVVNLTVTESTSFGFITVYPTSSPKPNVSNPNIRRSRSEWRGHTLSGCRHQRNSTKCEWRLGEPHSDRTDNLRLLRGSWLQHAVHLDVQSEFRPRADACQHGLRAHRS
jgi:hypothetical protein